MSENIYKSFNKHKNDLERLLPAKLSRRLFQDLGEYFVKHQKSIHVANFCNNSPNNDFQIFGNCNFPVDKRGIIDRINIDSELSSPFDTFFEYEGILLKKKIDQGYNIILLNGSMKNMYHSLFQHAKTYDSINTMVPSRFLRYHSNTSLLNYHARLRRRSAKNNPRLTSTRIMVMEKYNIKKDWENHNTRDLCIDFLNWHKDWGVTLLQIEQSYVNEIRRNIEESTNFRFNSMEVGFGKINILSNLGNIK
ncbi:MAG: hypothetical protein MRJ93_01645 [Nitrososphaeraceae archaeon]|nr:hypothetical protein [Nitrososphaeraceae archaeon]